jgi:hypothetical protein
VRAVCPGRCVLAARGFFFQVVANMGSTSHDSLVVTKSTELNPAQREMRLLGVARKPELVDWNVIAKCEDELAALQLCVHLSRLSNETIAFKLGIDKGHWSRIMQGRGHLPARKRTQLMAICGNLAPMQFDCLKFGFKLQVHDVEAELEEIEQKRAFLLAAREQQQLVAA